jgi:hypothetical protein
MIYSAGEHVDFAKLGDAHIPAALIKSFLRQLPEPVLTYDLYDHIVYVQCECILLYCSLVPFTVFAFIACKSSFIFLNGCLSF